MAAVSKNVYFDDLNDILNDYNNAFHKNITMKDINVKSDSYAECNVDFKEKDPKFKTGDHVIISKDIQFFAKEYIPNCLEEAFVISKIKNTVLRTYVINDLKGEEIVGTSYEKEFVKD